MNQSSVFALLGKLSSAEQPDQPEEYKQLFHIVNYKLADLLEKSDYGRKSALKEATDSILEICQLFLRYPFLASRTNVGVFPGKNREGLAFMKQLVRSTERPLFAKIRNLPCILYNSGNTEVIHVTNNAGNVIPVSVGEAESMLELYKQNIKIEDILQSCAISESLSLQHTNYVFFPRFAKKRAPDYRRLVGLCSAYFIFCSDVIEYEEIHDDVVSSKGLVYVVYKRGQEEKCRELLRIMSRHYPALRFSALLQDDVKQVLKEYDKPADNCVFCEAFLLSILKLAVSQTASYDQHSKRAKVLTEDSYQSEAEGAVKQTLQALREAELKASENAENVKSELEEVRTKLMEASLKLKNALFLSETEDNITEGLNPLLIRARYGEICGDIILSALKLQDFSTAQQYLSIMERVEHPCAYVYALYYSKAIGGPLASDKLKKLAQDAPENDVVIRAKINFAADIHLSDSERNDLASKLYGECSAEELYYKACRLEKNIGIAEAVVVQQYENAFQKGNIDAGRRLAEYYAQVNKLKSLKQCADKLVPEAALLYAKNCGNLKEKEKYLHIAVAQHYKPAIQYYANELYEDLTSLEYGGNKLPPKKLRIATRLFENLVRQDVYGSKNKYGVLLFLGGDYQKAKCYLDSGKDGKYYLGKMYAEGRGVSVDLDRAIKYLEESGTPQADILREDLLKRRAKEAVERAKNHNYNSNSSYESTTSDPHTDDSCFITTATCQAEGKADDCEELTAFRRYRDEVLLQSKVGKALVEEYYRIAPDIVDFIRNDPKCKEIYRYLYEHYISPGYNLLLKGEGDAAKKLYCEAVLALAKYYGVEISLDKFMILSKHPTAS